MSAAHSRRAKGEGYDRIKYAKELSLQYSDDIFARYIGKPGKRTQTEAGIIFAEFQNPFRVDTDTKSSTYYVKDAKFCDFGRGGQENDWLDCLQALGNARNVLEAADIIIEQFGAIGKRQQPQRNGHDTTGKNAQVGADEWTIVLPVPADAPPAKNVIWDGKENIPVDVRYHYTKDGQTLGYVLRVNGTETRKKEVRQCTLWRDSQGNLKWRTKHFPKPTPLYGQDLLKQYPDARVLLVEGEKCADTGNAALNAHGLVVLSWPGGAIARAYQKADLSPLKGREVICWPDHDKLNDDKTDLQPVEKRTGTIAMRYIASKVPGAKVLTIPDEFTHKWDIDDAINADGWSAERVVEFIDKSAQAPPAPLPERGFKLLPGETLTENRFFTAEGFTTVKGFVCHYFRKQGSISVRIPADNHTKSTMVDVLAPLEFFIAVTGADEALLENPKVDVAKVAISRAKKQMIDICTRMGDCGGETWRGRGIWQDGDQVVFHLGNRLFAGGQEVAIPDFKGKYRYRGAAPLQFDFRRVARASDGERLHKLLMMLPWARMQDAFLLGGWMFLAPVCGLLEWRPHIWPYGERGCGKTWVAQNILKPALEPLGVPCQGESTEAGVRQTLRGDARPVIFDEAEGNDDRKKQNMKRLLSLARQASSSGDFSVRKGTSDGLGTEYGLTTMFCFLSISPSAEEAADISRIAMLEFKRRANTAENEKAFRSLKASTKALLTPEYANSLVMRAVRMFSVIKQTIDVFAPVVTAIFGGDARMGDQYGTLLAGAWCLKNDAVPTEAQAQDMAAKFNWKEAQDTNEDTDAVECLRHLMQHKLAVRTDARVVDVTVGEMVARMFGKALEWETPIVPEAMNRELRNIGLWVRLDDPQGASLWILNKHKQLTEIFARTPFSMNWNKFLKLLSPDCHDNDPHSFTPTSKGRSWAIPKHVLLASDSEDGQLPPQPEKAANDNPEPEQGDLINEYFDEFGNDNFPY